jgi:hypothetical protein
MKKLPTLRRTAFLPAFLLLACLAANLKTEAQLSQPPRAAKDSIYYVHLLDGSTVYSRKVSLLESRSRGKYLQLDSSRTIPLEQVRDYKGWDGSFVVSTAAGKPYAYKLENEGRRISLYAVCYPVTETNFVSTTPDGPTFPETTTTTHKDFFFQKDDAGPVLPVNFKNLQDAMQDNPGSLKELQLTHSNIHVGIGLAAGGLALLGIGIAVTAHHNHLADEQYNQAFNQYSQELNHIPPFSPNWPLPPPALPNHIVSPLIYVGGAAIFSAIIPLASAGRHAKKAIDIYNDME